MSHELKIETNQLLNKIFDYNFFSMRAIYIIHIISIEKMFSRKFSLNNSRFFSITMIFFWQPLNELTKLLNLDRFVNRMTS